MVFVSAVAFADLESRTDGPESLSSLPEMVSETPVQRVDALSYQIAYYAHMFHDNDWRGSAVSVAAGYCYCRPICGMLTVSTEVPTNPAPSADQSPDCS